jgi:hypothetical protein
VELRSSRLVLVAEIGSTTTSINAFIDLDGDHPALAGQSQVLGTVQKGDVRKGLAKARARLEKEIGSTRGAELLAVSSAGGGLTVTVHGLVFEMTARAAREAALGAGAVVRMVTAGMLNRDDIKRVETIRPKLIFLAGGFDYGEERTVLENACQLAGLNCRAPVVYAGNVALQKRVAAVFARANRDVYLLPNVYPGIDQLVVEPARSVLHRIFEERITEAPGMDRVREMVDGRIVPTPGALIMAAEALREEIGDLLVVDVGGATTDVYSVTEGSACLRDYSVDPEPLTKRTVEGDLGIHYNTDWFTARAMDNPPPALPATGEERRVASLYAGAAAEEAVRRHAGSLKQFSTPTGNVEVIVGRDLTAVKCVVGTGGALTRLDHGMEILGEIRHRSEDDPLLLPESPRLALDRHHVMASCGALMDRWPRAAMILLRRSLGI